MNGTVIIIGSQPLTRSPRTAAHFSYYEPLGYAVARYLTRQGYEVIGIDESGSVGSDSASGEIFAAHHTCSLISFDDLQHVADLYEGKTITGLVNFHSDLEIASIALSSIDSWKAVIEFNLLGPVVASKAFLPRMASGSSIVNIGTIDGTLGNPQIPSYSAAKGGLIALTHVMAAEFGASGIRVNCLARAMVSALGAPLNPMYETLLQHTPLGRPATPDEIGGPISFLLGRESSYITGSVITVDGGRSVITPGTWKNN